MGTRLSPARAVARSRASEAPSAPSYKGKERISYVESCAPAKRLFRPERGIACLDFYAAHRMPAVHRVYYPKQVDPLLIGSGITDHCQVNDKMLHKNFH